MSTDPSSNPTSTRWWLAVDGQPDGPRTTAYITAALQAGRLSSLTPVCPEGGCEWRPLATWPALASAQAVAPQAPLPPNLLIGGPAGFGSERLLTSASLPPMANLICIYSIAVVPIYWLFGFAVIFTTDNPFLDGTGYYVAYGLNLLLNQVATLAIAVLLAIGGMRLRDLRSSGERLVRLTLSLSLVWTATQWIVVIGLIILGGISNAIEESTDTSLSALDVMHLFLAIAALACDVIGLIWLLRNRSRLSLNPHA